jgi:hypothetical protein
VARNLTHELLPRAGEIAKLLDRRRWQKNRADQPVRQELGQSN